MLLWIFEFSASAKETTGPEERSINTNLSFPI
jgi:hypothetical protein